MCQDLGTITDIIKVVAFLIDAEQGSDVSENDARFVVERFHHFCSKGILEKLFRPSDQGQITFRQEFLTREMSSAHHEPLQTKALVGASATIREAKAIVEKLGGNCSTPDKQHLQSWAVFEFHSDFEAALGVLNSVSRRSLVHTQVQFLYMCATFLRDASALSLARSSA